MSQEVDHGRDCLLTHGDPALLDRPALGLVCSVRCPGSVILKLYDAVRALRDAGVTVIGGFHSPMERDCLDLLLRGEQPIIIATPRPLVRIDARWRTAVAEGRLAIITPGETTARRTTAALAERRNQLVADVASVLFVPYASPGGKTERLVAATLGAARPLLTFDDPANSGLIAGGAVAVAVQELVSRAALDRFLGNRAG